MLKAETNGPGLLPLWLVAISLGALAILLSTAGPMLVFGLATLIALAAIAFYFPMFAVAAYAVLVVTNAADVATEFHSAPPIGGLLVPGLLVLLALRGAAGLEDLRTSIYVLVPVGIFFSMNALGLLWVEQQSPTVERISDLLKNLLIFIMICGFVTTRQRLVVICYAIGAAASGLAALSVFQYATGTFETSYLGFSTATVKNIFGEVDNWRLQGPIGDPNYYGQLLVTCLPLVLALAIVAKPPLLRLCGVIGVPLVVAAIFFTFSRGALVTVGGLAVLSLLLSRHRLSILVVVLFAGGVSFLAVPDMIMGRLLPVLDAIDSAMSGAQAISDPALAQRVNVMRAGLIMFENNPILGIGIGQFQYNYVDFALANGLDIGAPSQAHNRYIELAAEQGIVGVVVFFSMIAIVIGAGSASLAGFRRSGDRVAAGLVFGLLLGLAGYLMSAVFLHDDYTRVFWLFASLLVSAYAVSSRERD